MPYKVLVVDDQAMPRQLFESIIRFSDNYELAASVDSASVADVYSAKKEIDLILMDVVMSGGINGIEAAARIKGSYPNIKILVVTSMPDGTFLKKARDAGVDSFKVEGRTKSLYYVSAVAKTYRNAIDELYQNPNADMGKYFVELQKVGNRGYTTGFALGENDCESYSYNISKGLAGADFLFEFLCKKDDGYLVRIKNKVLLNDEIEIITPSEQFITKITSIVDDKGFNLDVANTNSEVYLKFDCEPKNHEYALARTIGVKNYVS